AFWTKHLETLENITLPYEHRKTPHLHTAQRLSVPMSVPREILNALDNRFATCCRGEVLLAAFAAYLARLAGVRSFAIGYTDPELKRDVADLEGLFAAYVPLHLLLEEKQSFEEIVPAVQEQVKLAKRRKTYARDVRARYPVLRSKTTWQGAPVPSICVERGEALPDYQASSSNALTLLIREDG